MAGADVNFGADDNGLLQMISQIGRRMSVLQSHIAGVAGAFLGIAGASMSFEQFRNALDLGGALSDLSANTGSAVGDLVVLQQEFSNAGQAAEQVGPTLSKLARFMSGDKAADSVGRLGLQLDQLRSQTPTEQLRSLGAAINRIENPSQRAAAAMEIFGESGSKLLALFSSDGFGDASAQLGSQAQILDRSAALFDDVGDKLGLTGLKLQGFWVGVADKVAPVLKPLLDRFATLDLASWGQKAGEAVALIVQAFADGKLGDLIFGTLEVGGAKVLNILSGSLAAVGAGLMQSFGEGAQNAVAFFEILSTKEFWNGMGDALLSIADRFAAVLLEGVATMLDWVSNVPGLGSGLAEGAKGLRSTAAELRESGQAQTESSQEWLEPAMQKVRERMRASYEAIEGAAKTAFAAHQPYDVASLETKVAETLDQILNRVDSVTAESRTAMDGPSGPPTAADEDAVPSPDAGQARTQPVVSALQRIGGGGVAYGGTDPILREQQRQTRELSVQTGLLRDVKRAIESQKLRVDVPAPSFS